MFSRALSLFPLLFAPAARVDDPSPAELLAKMRDAYREVKTATFETKCDLDEKGMKLAVTLKVEFAGPNRMRAVLSGLPGPYHARPAASGAEKKPG